MRTPSAPPWNAARTASSVPPGVHLLWFSAVGISMSIPGQRRVLVPSSPALAAAVVVDDDLEKVGMRCDGSEVLLGTINGIEGVVMPNVPANLDRRLDRLDLFIDCGISLPETVGPQHLPSEQLRIAQHEAPHRD